jgi:hypothetical protein
MNEQNEYNKQLNNKMSCAITVYKKKREKKALTNYIIHMQIIY